MTDAIQVLPFSKGKTLLRFDGDSSEYSYWDKKLTKIGASRNNSSDDPGWLMPKDKMHLLDELMDEEYDKYEKSKKAARTKKSKESLEEYGREVKAEKAKKEKGRSSGGPGGPGGNGGERKGSRFRAHKDKGDSSAAALPKKRSREDDSPERDSDHDQELAGSERGRRRSANKRDSEKRSDDERKHPRADAARHESSRSRDDQSSRESYPSEDEDSSDDELIQNVLARRLMSESSQKVIDMEAIPNSDEEDCVSYSRRLRHVYGVVESLRQRIKTLEDAVVAKHIPTSA
jgi:hypothetical protein